MKIFYTVLITYVGAFVDSLSASFIISSHVINESSIVLAKYSTFP